MPTCQILSSVNKPAQAVEAVASPPEANEVAVPTSAQAMLAAWANKQDGWVRLLVSEVLATQGPLSETARDKVFDQFLAEKGLSDGEASAVPAIASPDATTSEKASFVITKLSDVSAVNALAPDQVIEFNAGLTIFFGENGAGKTGYTRILKKLAAVRTAEDILGDVHDPAASGEPEATIKYTLNDEPAELVWKGEAGVPPFTSISVFDTPAVSLHVDDDLSYVYTPADLALFPHVSSGINAIQGRLTEVRDERRPAGNPFLQLFQRDTKVYAEIESLSAATSLESLKSLADVPAEEAATLETLEGRVAALTSSTVTAELAVARTSQQRYEALATAAAAVSRFDAVSYATAIETLDEATEAYSSARSDLFASAGLEGEGDDVWQTMVLSADAYWHHREIHDYPDHADACVYCQQPLGDEARELLGKYRAFASDASRKRIEDAQNLATTLGREVRAVDTTNLIDAVTAELGDKDDAHLAEAGEFLAQVRTAADAISTRKAVEGAPLTQSAGRVLALATERAKVAAETVTALTEKTENRAQALASAKAEYGSLKDRLTLADRLQAIGEHVSALQWDTRAQAVAGRTPAVLRSLTETAKVASQDLLNTDFEDRFKKECARLRAPEVGLEFPGSKGQAARRKKVTTYKPSAVLSEGEQKVIALADFLAEAGLRITDAPIVFDDPVNSLDYRRIHEVANRVASLAQDRQVMVFTHNIWFATELLSRFEKNKARCSYYTITDDSAKGVVASGSHPRWDTLAKTKGQINKVIQDAHGSDGETREALVERGYSRLRSWCEIAVEIELLGGVTQRYQPNVMMGNLSTIKGDKLQAAIDVIVPVFEKACRIMDGHSQPLETLGTRATLEALEADWGAVQSALKDYTA